MVNLLKSIGHNIGVLIVGFVAALVGKGVDALAGLHGFASVPAAVLGSLLLALGFLLRAWAAYRFYQHRMKVILLAPQATLITSGPYAFSRNPLYLGGNVFIFFGAALVLGSPFALIITAVHLPLVDFLVRREERQLEKRFGKAWVDYRKRVRRWI